MLETRTHLSNIQKELLKLYSTDLPDHQLEEIKLLLSQYFAQKLTDAMDQFCKDENIMISWTNEHNRHKNSGSSFASLWFERWLVWACKCALAIHFHLFRFNLLAESFFQILSASSTSLSVKPYPSFNIC